MKIEIIEKPSVPQIVADWLERLHDGGEDPYVALGIILDFNGLHYAEAVYDWVADNKDEFIIASLYGYNIKQEPLYYAKIKGWELTSSGCVFWNYYPVIESPLLPRICIGNKEEDVFARTKMTKAEWNELGINDSNADFEEVEE